MPMTPHASDEAKPPEEVPFVRRLNIGPRLTLCFALIIVAMLAGNGVVLWQFERARAGADRLSQVDQGLIAVLQARAGLMSLYERVDALAQSQDTGGLLREAELLQAALLEDARRSREAFGRLEPEAGAGRRALPTLEAIHGALPEQLERITALAKAKDWDGVRRRLTMQVRPLESRVAELAESMDREVSEERARALRTIQQAQRRILLIAPATAVLTLAFAALLGIGITGSITRPLRSLMEASSALGRGQFQHCVSTAGTDELARLGQVFNQTAETLRGLYEAVSTREAYLAEAQRLSQTGSFGWNLMTGELVWSDETFRIFEYSRTAQPTIEMVLQRTHPDDRERVQQLADRISDGEMNWDIEHRLRMPGGAVKHVRAVAHATKDSAGQVQFVGAVMDLTERKRNEEALRETQTTLARVMRVTSLGEMAASIAHEINQPLAAAVTDANTCVRWLARDLPNVEEARAAAARSAKAVTRGAEIIKRIRVLFKRGTPQREPVDVNELVLEMVHLMRNEADRNSVSIRTELASDLPKLAADRVQLQQVLMNLIWNGIEAIKGVNGPGELTLSSQQRDDGSLLLSVRDTGVGLATSGGDQIFQAFFTTKPEGTGMGLAVSRSIIESHGGRLWAIGNAEQGATFYFTLPLGGEASE
jgi:C4-dicarboxylate-specific signal transduction histidine kinase